MVGRILVLVLSAIAFLIANSKGSGAQAIMDMVENAWGAFGASFGPTILLSPVLAALQLQRVLWPALSLALW